MPFDKKAHGQKYYKENRDRLVALHKKWIEENREKKRAYDQEYMRRYRIEHPEYRESLNARSREYYYKKGRKNHLKYKFNLTPEQFNEMVVKQSNKCAICGLPSKENKNLDIDHCHDTNKVRELLCNTCNRAIGLMKHDPILLEKAAAYLRKHRGESKMQITNGVVEFERLVTPAQYEKKAAKVTLHFTVDEGEELASVMARVADVAHAEVFALLRKPESSAHNDDAAREALQTRRLNMTPSPGPVAVKTPPAPVVQENLSTRTVPLDGVIASLPADQQVKIEARAAELIAEVEPVGSVSVITDAELTTICQRTTARMAGPEATKAVIAQFVEQPGMPVRTIPQEKRPAFVAALEALKRDEKVADY